MRFSSFAEQQQKAVESLKEQFADSPEDVFVQAILEDVNDDSRWMAYGDWLEEHRRDYTSSPLWHGMSYVELFQIASQIPDKDLHFTDSQTAERYYQFVKDFDSQAKKWLKFWSNEEEPKWKTPPEERGEQFADTPDWIDQSLVPRSISWIRIANISHVGAAWLHQSTYKPNSEVPAIPVYKWAIEEVQSNEPLQSGEWTADRERAWREGQEAAANYKSEEKEVPEKTAWTGSPDQQAEVDIEDQRLEYLGTFNTYDDGNHWESEVYIQSGKWTPGDVEVFRWRVVDEGNRWGPASTWGKGKHATRQGGFQYIEQEDQSAPDDDEEEEEPEEEEENPLEDYEGTEEDLEGLTGWGGDVLDSLPGDPPEIRIAPFDGKLYATIKHSILNGASTRTIDLSNRTIHNDMFKIKPEYQRLGFGADVFASQVYKAIEEGFLSIETHAAGNYESMKRGQFNGYYTWAILGYDQDLESVFFGSSRLQEAQDLFGAETVQDLMDTKEGREWWKVKGNSMESAVFDLRKGSRSRQRMENYLESLSHLNSMIRRKPDLLLRVVKEEGFKDEKDGEALKYYASQDPDFKEKIEKELDDPNRFRYLGFKEGSEVEWGKGEDIYLSRRQLAAIKLMWKKSTNHSEKYGEADNDALEQALRENPTDKGIQGALMDSYIESGMTQEEAEPAIQAQVLLQCRELALEHLDEFVTGYLEGILFGENADWWFGDDGEPYYPEPDSDEASASSPLDMNYGIYDFSAEARTRAEETCRDFVESAAVMLVELGLNRMRDAGSNLYFVQAGHGVGYWDGDWEPYGSELTELARGHFNGVYLNDQGDLEIQ